MKNTNNSNKLQDKFKLNGKVVVITGGSGALGGAIANGIVSFGVKIAILGFKKKEVAEKLAYKLRKNGKDAISVECNVLEHSSLEHACKEILNKFGRIDILINAAGGNHPDATTSKETFDVTNLKKENIKTFFDLDSDAIQSVFNLNFLGTLLACQVFGKPMVDKGGVILNVSSMNAFRPLTKIPAYSASKAAVSNFTKWLATYFSKVNIRVNAIAPGFFLTPQNKFLLTDEKTGELTPRGKKIINHTPMLRFGKPEDIIGTVVWLVSDASSFVTGIVVPVDGGFSSYSGV